MALTYVGLFGICWNTLDIYRETKDIFAISHTCQLQRVIHYCSAPPNSMISVRTKSATFSFHFGVRWVDAEFWLSRVEQVPWFYGLVKALFLLSFALEESCAPLKTGHTEDPSRKGRILPSHCSCRIGFPLLALKVHA